MEKSKIIKGYKNYKIMMIQEKESLNILIYNKSSSENYESNLKLKYLQKKFVLNSIKEIIDYLSVLIIKEKIEIENTKLDLKLIIKQDLQNHQIEELKIKKKGKLLEKIFDEIQIINPNLKFLKKIEIKNIYTFYNLLGILPSGRLIYLNGKSLFIYDTNFNILQTTDYEELIYNLVIKDENEFLTVDREQIKIWNKINNIYKIRYIINNKIKYNTRDFFHCYAFYDRYNNILSTSMENMIRIWEYNKQKNEYQLQSVINDIFVVGFLLLKDKNILITSGEETIFWNMNNYNCLISFNAECINYETLKQINDDRIIVGGGKNYTMKIISISEKKIIKNIKLCSECFDILVFKDKSIFMVFLIKNGLFLQFYRNDNLNCIKQITFQMYGIYNVIKLNKDKLLFYGNEFNIFQLYEE
jgi:WD40 repeat protein